MVCWIQHVEDMQDQRSAPIHKRSNLGADQILELAKNRPPGYLHQPVVDSQFENSHLHCLLLVFISSLEYLPNSAATSAKQ